MTIASRLRELIWKRIKKLAAVAVLGWSASKSAFAFLLVLTLMAAALPTAVIVVQGLLVGEISRTVGNEGDRSGLGPDILTLILASLYLATGAISAGLNSTTRVLTRRYTLVGKKKVVEALLAPVGIAHLENPSIADEIETVIGPSQTYAWQAAIPLGIQLLIGWISGLGAVLLLARFRWWAPLVGILGWVPDHRFTKRAVEALGASFDMSSSGLRRADYFREAATAQEFSKEVRIFGISQWLLDRFKGAWTRTMAQAWGRRAEARGWLMITALARFGGAAVILLLLGKAGWDREISIAELAIYAQCIPVIVALGHQGDAQTYFGHGSGLALRALNLIERSHRSRRPSGREIKSFQGSISLRDLTFHYPEQEVNVLEGLNLDIPVGKSTALVGLNGSGKTTLIKLLTRLYEPSAGAIYIGDVDLKEIDVNAWRRLCAAIFQDFAKYPFSLRENVGFGRLELIDDDEEILKALAFVGFDGEAGGLSAGWDTILSRHYSGGAELSGGQWQKIALARAFLAVQGGAAFLVLDEPTANLDVRSEFEIFSSFLHATRGITTLLISHRLASVRQADQIAVLSHGRIVELGSHAELMNQNGQYASLFNLQAKAFTAE